MILYIILGSLAILGGITEIREWNAKNKVKKSMMNFTDRLVHDGIRRDIGKVITFIIGIIILIILINLFMNSLFEGFIALIAVVILLLIMLKD